jgi:hypothetical protein
VGFLAAVSAAVVFSGRRAPGQVSRPDFSGTWTLVSSSGAMPDAPLWSEGSITQDASSLSFAGNAPSTSRDASALSLRLDGQGTERTLTTVLGGRWTLVSHTKWDANALVITTTYRTAIGQWDDWTTLSLDPAGNLSVVTNKTPKQSDVPRNVTQYTYKRR